MRSSFSTLQRVLTVVWLSLLVIGWLRFDPVLVVAAALVSAAVFLFARFGRRAVSVVKAARRGVSEPRLVQVEIRRPSLRFREREAVTFAALASALEQARVGKVTLGRERLTVTSEQGERVELQSTSELVTLFTVTAQATDAELAVLVCDALVRVLGPMRVRLDGVELELDGTQPEQELSRQLWLAQTDRVRQLETMLRVAEQRKDPSSKFVQ